MYILSHDLAENHASAMLYHMSNIRLHVAIKYSSHPPAENHHWYRILHTPRIIYPSRRRYQPPSHPIPSHATNPIPHTLLASPVLTAIPSTIHVCQKANPKSPRENAERPRATTGIMKGSRSSPSTRECALETEVVWCSRSRVC